MMCRKSVAAVETLGLATHAHNRARAGEGRTLRRYEELAKDGFTNGNATRCWRSKGLERVEGTTTRHVAPLFQDG